MAYLVLLSGMYYFIVVVLVSLFKSKLLFAISKVCCELLLVYMPVLFWVTSRLTLFVAHTLPPSYWFTATARYNLHYVCYRTFVFCMSAEYIHEHLRHKYINGTVPIKK